MLTAVMALALIDMVGPKRKSGEQWDLDKTLWTKAMFGCRKNLHKSVDHNAFEFRGQTNNLHKSQP